MATVRIHLFTYFATLTLGCATGCAPLIVAGVAGVAGFFFVD